jgi:tripartite-type tricarboxylate transporter receptor subunit TctC
MCISRRAATLLAVLGAVAVLTPIRSAAFPTFSDWPTRSVKIIVPFAPGTTNDIAARLYAEGLAKRWRRPVVVENRLGTDTIIGGCDFANAKDGHTLLYGSTSTIAVSPLLRPHEWMQDLVPIAYGGSSILTIAVTSKLPAHSLKDLVELARSRPHELSWGAAPSLPAFAFAATVKRHQLYVAHVPYRDAVTQRSDLSKGRLHVLSNSLQAVSGPVVAGEARILAVTSPQREPALPDVPTVAEAGFPEMEIEELSGLFGWRSMPAELRDRIAADMRAIAGDAFFRERIEAGGQRVRSGTPTEFAAAIGRQRIRIQQIMHTVDLKSVARALVAPPREQNDETGLAEEADLECGMRN